MNNNTNQIDKILKEKPDYFKVYMAGMREWYHGKVNAKASEAYHKLTSEEKELVGFFNEALKKLKSIETIVIDG